MSGTLTSEQRSPVGQHWCLWGVGMGEMKLALQVSEKSCKMMLMEDTMAAGLKAVLGDVHTNMEQAGKSKSLLASALQCPSTPFIDRA